MENKCTLSDEDLITAVLDFNCLLGKHGAAASFGCFLINELVKRFKSHIQTPVEKTAFSDLPKITLEDIMDDQKYEEYYNRCELMLSEKNKRIKSPALKGFVTILSNPGSNVLTGYLTDLPGLLVQGNSDSDVRNKLASLLESYIKKLEIIPQDIKEKLAGHSQQTKSPAQKLIENIENVNFQWEAGPLVNFVPWIELKKILNDLPQRGCKGCK